MMLLMPMSLLIIMVMVHDDDDDGDDDGVGETMVVDVEYGVVAVVAVACRSLFGRQDEGRASYQ